MTEAILIGILALAIGALAGWLLASRRGTALASDLAVATARAAEFDMNSTGDCPHLGTVPKRGQSLATAVRAIELPFVPRPAFDLCSRT